MINTPVPTRTEEQNMVSLSLRLVIRPLRHPVWTPAETKTRLWTWNIKAAYASCLPVTSPETIQSCHKNCNHNSAAPFLQCKYSPILAMLGCRVGVS